MVAAWLRMLIVHIHLSSLVAVVSSTMNDFNYFLLYSIYKPVFFVNFSAPIPGHLVFQRFRFADSIVPVALNIFYQQVDSLQGLFVLGLPVQIIFPGFFVPNFTHFRPLSVRAPPLFRHSCGLLLSANAVDYTHCKNHRCG